MKGPSRFDRGDYRLTEVRLAIQLGLLSFLRLPGILKHLSSDFFRRPALKHLQAR